MAAPDRRRRQIPAERVLTNADLEKHGRDHRPVDRRPHRHPRAPHRRRRRDAGHASAPRPPAWPSKPPACSPTTSTSSICATLHAGRHVPGDGVADPGRHRRPARRRLRRQRRLHGLPQPPSRRARSSSTPASTSACSSSAPRSSRASSTGRTARPASCSAMAPARWCWSAATRAAAVVRAEERRRGGEPALRPRPCQLAERFEQTEGYCIVMDGREVFKFAVRAMEDATRQSLPLRPGGRRHGLVVPHQANQRIMTALAKGLGLDPSA